MRYDILSFYSKTSLKKNILVSAQNNIIDKLDAFIRKYYKNKLFKGLIYSVALILMLYIAVVLLEHFGYFSVAVRTVLFWLFIVAMAVILSMYVAVPVFKMFKMGKRISYEEAAEIVGNHFPEVSDKLLNLLQLQQMSNDSDSELLQASIEQKTALLSPIPFLNAIDLRKNIKYIKFAAIPLGFIVLALIIAPSLITEPSKRIINHNTFYEKPAPFAFVLDNDSLSVPQQADFQVRVHIEGDEIPNEVSILVDGVGYRMQKVDNTHFTYKFSHLQRSHEFQFQAVGVMSHIYSLEVLPRPAVMHFQALLSYPSYTGISPETIVNEGDFSVPKGTRIEWLFQTKDADTLHFAYDGSGTDISTGDYGRTRVSVRAMNAFTYSFHVDNRFVASDTLSYAVTVIDDAYPMIAVVEMTDSLMPDRRYFKGQVKDDYGISKLELIIDKTNAEDSSVHENQHIDVPVTADASQDFYYSIDFNQLVSHPGDQVKYYFEVWDNDGVNGSKSTKSQVFEILVPSEKEINDILRTSSSAIQQQGELSISELKKLQDEINEMMRKLVDKKELSWQDKKQLEELKNKQAEIKNQLQQMRQQMNENKQMEEKFRDQSQQLMEKQKELDKLFDEVMNEEIKEMMKEMDRLMNEMDKKKVQDELESLKLKNEDLEKQLDQNIELLKRLEIEKKVEQAVNKADELSKKQNELSQNKNADAHENLQQQRKLSEEFKQLQKDIDQIQKDYKNLDSPEDFKVDKELQNQIEQHQREAENKLSNGKKKDAQKSQKSAAEELQKLSEQLAEAQMDMEQEDLAEDSEQVRRLLKTLVHLSFNQESLINTLSSISIQDPKYQQIIADQNRLKDDFRNVEDSLRAMAKRQITIATVVNKELVSVNTNIAQSLSGLLQYNQSIYGNFRNTAPSKPMQYSMTSLNNLSLLLAESLDQMQNQMRQNQQQKKQGSCKRQGMKMKSGQCENPGNSKPSPKSMRQMQDELNKQLQQLKSELEKQGGKPGRTKIGERNSMSSEFAKMAAKQEMIRRMMQEYGQEMKQQSGGNGKLAREIDEIIKQMEQTETDLVNKTITRQTIQRQQQIMTRLLQHEKAEMQREKDDRRESTEGKDLYQPSQGDLEKFKKIQENNMEQFHTTPPSLNNYYKEKVNSYFFKF